MKLKIKIGCNRALIANYYSFRMAAQQQQLKLLVKSMEPNMSMEILLPLFVSVVLSQ